MKLLLFVGAGASVELGVPAMRKMTEQLADHLNQQGIDEGLIKRLKARLDSPEYDMEELVEDLDKLVEASKAAERWRFEDESTQEKRKMTILRQETEWFVQHVCERVQLHHAQRLWTGLLTELSNHDSTIATTNYDRAVELASSSSAVQLEDGFMEFEKSEVTEWEGFSGNSISYLKLHGSTNWYRSENEDVYKLRHPMALFGNLRLVVPHHQGPKVV
jgi:NAD-dependent SIR2 family protein deacetylase